MSAFSLLGKIGIDASGFTRAVAGLKSSLLPAADGIGKQIKQRMVAAITLGTSVAIIQKQLRNAVEIRTGATKNGTDTQRFQTLKIVADRAGTSVESLVGILNKGGPSAEALESALIAAQAELEATGRIISDEAIIRLATLSDQLDTLFGRLAPGLTMLVEGLISFYDAISKSEAMRRGGERLYGAGELGSNATSGIKNPKAVMALTAISPLLGAFLTAKSVKESLAKSDNDVAKQLIFGTGEDKRDDPPKKITYNAVESAADALSRILREIEASKGSKTKDTTKAPTVSQLVQVGGLLRPGMNSISVQQQMADRLRNIETLIRGAKD